MSEKSYFTPPSTSCTAQLGDIAIDMKTFLQRRHLYTLDEQIRALSILRERVLNLQPERRAEPVFESVTGIFDPSEGEC
jgi:hypothetical protein